MRNRKLIDATVARLRRLALGNGIALASILSTVACSDDASTDGGSVDASASDADGDTGCDGPCTGVLDGSPSDATVDVDLGHLYCTEDPNDMFECPTGHTCCGSKELCFDPQLERVGIDDGAARPDVRRPVEDEKRADRVTL